MKTISSKAASRESRRGRRVVARTFPLVILYTPRLQRFFDGCSTTRPKKNGVVGMSDRHRTNAKNLERRVAKALGGTRNGPNPGSDVKGTPFAVECKRMQRLALRSDHLAQAKRQGLAEGKPWILVLCEHGSDEPLVVMPFKRWVDSLASS